MLWSYGGLNVAICSRSLTVSVFARRERRNATRYVAVRALSLCWMSSNCYTLGGVWTKILTLTLQEHVSGCWMPLHFSWWCYCAPVAWCLTASNSNRFSRVKASKAQADLVETILAATLAELILESLLRCLNGTCLTTFCEVKWSSMILQME